MSKNSNGTRDMVDLKGVMKDINDIKLTIAKKIDLNEPEYIDLKNKVNNLEKRVEKNSTLLYNVSDNVSKLQLFIDNRFDKIDVKLDSVIKDTEKNTTISSFVKPMIIGTVGGMSSIIISLLISKFF